MQDGGRIGMILQDKTGNQGVRRNSFEFIITNPPFGSVIEQTEKAYLHQYSLATKDVDWLNPASKAADRPSQSSEVLFIEQAEKYLADGGYLAIVLPDGILTNSSMKYVRDYISDTFRVVAVVSMPQTALMEKCYPSAKKVTRYAIKKDTVFDPVMLQNNIEKLPAGYELKRIDADIYNQCLENPATADLLLLLRVRRNTCKWAGCGYNKKRKNCVRCVIMMAIPLQIPRQQGTIPLSM